MLNKGKGEGRKAHYKLSTNKKKGDEFPLFSHLTTSSTYFSIIPMNANNNITIKCWNTQITFCGYSAVAIPAMLAMSANRGELATSRDVFYMLLS